MKIPCNCGGKTEVGPEGGEGTFRQSGDAADGRKAEICPVCGAGDGGTDSFDLEGGEAEYQATMRIPKGDVAGGEGGE